MIILPSARPLAREAARDEYDDGDDWTGCSQRVARLSNLCLALYTLL